MNKIFNKTFFGFMTRFAAIILLGLVGVFLMESLYTFSKHQSQASPAPADVAQPANEAHGM